MITLILKDSIILFLLIYAILTLAEQFLRFLMRFLEQRSDYARSFHVLDISGTHTTQLEHIIRSFVGTCKETVFLVTETSDPETNAIVHNLCREFDVLFAVSRAEFLRITGSLTALDAFLKDEQGAIPSKNK